MTLDPPDSLATPTFSGVSDYSVVIPCRNAAPWISACIASCMRQEPLPREIVLVDDGSTDGSAAIAQNAERPAGVALRVIREEGIGSAPARDRGADAASSTWLLFLDADDELEPGAVGRLLEHSASRDVVYGDALLADASGAEIGVKSMAPSVAHPVARILFKAPLCGTALIRREARVAWNGSHDEVDEFYFFAHLAVCRRSFVHVPTVVLRYRQHESPARKSNRGFDYGTSLGRAFLSLWDRCLRDGSADEQLRAFMAWIMADLSMRAASTEVRVPVSRHADELRGYRWRRFGFALRHYGVKRVARILHAWPRVERNARQLSDSARETEVSSPSGAHAGKLDRASLSIVIPSKNGGPWLAEACRSALACDPMEVVVVDDGGNPELLDAEPWSDHRVRVVQGPRCGVSSARNAGQDAARGDFILFLDADDLLEPEAVRSALVAMAESNAPGCIGNWRDVDSKLMPMQDSDGVPLEADALLAFVERPTVVSAVIAARPWPRWEDRLSVWEVSRWHHDLAAGGRRFARLGLNISTIRQHSSVGRISLDENHFDPQVCGRFWRSERVRMSAVAGPATLGAMDRRVCDSVYALLRVARDDEARALWRDLDRHSLRMHHHARIGQARWCAGFLGFAALRAHARIARLRDAIFRVDE